MNKDIFEGSIGVRITGIDDPLGEIKKLSDLRENWDFEAQCTTCGRVLIFNKNRVNKLITCPCGQKICVQIKPELM